MREAPRELGEGFAVYSAELNELRSGLTCMGTIDPVLPDVSGRFEETKHRDFTANWANAAAAMTSQSRRQQSLSDRSSNSVSPKSSAPRRKDATKSSYDF